MEWVKPEGVALVVGAIDDESSFLVLLITAKWDLLP